MQAIALYALAGTVAHDLLMLITTQAERLFQPFQRLHDQRYPRDGVGLGIVERIVERHGGQRWAHANLSATFFFSLPRVRHSPPTLRCTRFR